MKMTILGTRIAILSLWSLGIVSLGDMGDTENLLKFKDSLANPSSLRNWNASTSPCKGSMANWIGVICVKNKIWGLQLENMNLRGLVNIQILDKLPTLRIISLMNNDFEGIMVNIRKLEALKALYLSNNRFHGEIPGDAFEGMRSLKKVFLANNVFSGKIPSSLRVLPNLVILRLEGNQFEGHIPDFKQELKVVCLANNKLEGPIPKSLSRMSATMFSGNKNLCGKPLQACTSSPPRPPPSSKEKTLSSVKIALIVLSTALLLLIIAILILFLTWRTHTESQKANVVNEAKRVSKSGSMVKAAGFDHGSTLMFLRDGAQRFDLQDLLKASAEVLGSGNLGASYKVEMEKDDGVVVAVVKRYKQMNNAGKDEFYEHMTRLGKLNHKNLLPLMAYHYMKEEKLLVSQYTDNGSLATHLHGNPCEDKPGLSWQTRLKIIKGIARGLSHLYKELPTLILPHGNLKSSNVLLDHTFKPLMCDYGLTPLINQEQVHMFMAAYKSPEYALKGRVSKKTDVWCLGILILELLTGKLPENYVQPKYNSKANLGSWVKEKMSSESVFDDGLLGTKDDKRDEVMSVLKIGLKCCEEDLNKRPELKQVVQEIEQLGDDEDEDEDDDDDDDDEFCSTICEMNASICSEKCER
ncbi:hypothetical protein ES319_D10G002200v1 [Gossypium barbadense]|uniref:Protein kinase domain-containing protein n=2 Tax=Gossypium TaxID=3633 RepID=A0A5J5PMG3_GOSBA|nr:hypothetical protein ES319_D10G002200v1 [Gossypium barbadense]TYG48297.1 hypothetical protein ES288_D10G002300v1 [Gossypium darwinii]